MTDLAFTQCLSPLRFLIDHKISEAEWVTHMERIYFPRLVSDAFQISRPDGAPATRSAQNSQNGTQCLSGGLGALGLVISRFFLEQGNRHLVVTSRSVGKTFDPANVMSTHDQCIGLYANTCDVSSVDDVV
jgi:hypothetical protein